MYVSSDREGQGSWAGPAAAALPRRPVAFGFESSTRRLSRSWVSILNHVSLGCMDLEFPDPVGLVCPEVGGKALRPVCGVFIKCEEAEVTRHSVSL